MDYIPARCKLVDRGRDRCKATGRTRCSITSRVTSRRGCAGSPASGTGMGLLGLWNAGGAMRSSEPGPSVQTAHRLEPPLPQGCWLAQCGPTSVRSCRHVVQQEAADGSPRVARQFACGTPGTSSGKQVEVAPTPLDRWQAKSRAAPDTTSAIRSERPSTSSFC